RHDWVRSRSTTSQFHWTAGRNLAGTLFLHGANGGEGVRATPACQIGGGFWRRRVASSAEPVCWSAPGRVAPQFLSPPASLHIHLDNDPELQVEGGWLIQ